MGNAPSKPTDEQLAELTERLDEIIERAACAIVNADVLLVATGAGWSADSGLAIYRDVADVEAYRSRGVTYHDLCQPQVLDDDPALFMGFWGGCFNDYRATKPHKGYEIIARWRDRLFPRRGQLGNEIARLLRDENDPRPQTFAGPFFSLTSNVDAHWLHERFTQSEVFECHGNTERWQCANRACKNELTLETKDQVAIEGIVDGSWRAPPGFAFAIDGETRLAPEEAQPATAASTEGCGCWEQPHDARAFAGNWPRCVKCNGIARPAVLMFNDSSWAPNAKAKDRWDNWQWAVKNLCQGVEAEHEDGGGAAAASSSCSPARALSVAVLEIGCGANVTTIRQKTENFVEELRDRGARATLIRVNPEYPLADGAAARPVTLPVLSTGLAAVQSIDAALQRRLPKRGTPIAAAKAADPMEGLVFEHISLASDEQVDEQAGGAAAAGAAQRATTIRTMADKVKKMDTDLSEKMSSVDKVLAEIRETQRKFDRFDALGEQLKGALGQLIAEDKDRAAAATE